MVVAFMQQFSERMDGLLAVETSGPAWWETTILSEVVIGNVILHRLRLHGPQTYGAIGAALGWGATRAWRAEAKLRAAGLVVYRDGRAVPVAVKCDNITP